MNAEPVKVGHCIHYPDAILTLTACWPCQLNHCPGGWHTWASTEDVEFALAANQPDPSGEKCGCACADGHELDDEPVEVEPLNAGPCPICGADGACGYDSDGLPMIHALSGEDDS